MTKNLPSASPYSSKIEGEISRNLDELFANNGLGNELTSNLPLFLTRQVFMRQLFFKELYEQIINVHGVLMEFGCRWGTNLATMTALRGIYEPYNHNRKIVAFDTFEGLRGITSQDGDGELVVEGAYATADNYEDYLSKILTIMEGHCPISHIKKHELVKGDVRETLPKYLTDNPQTVVALAYLDMDLYEPTKVALEALLPHLTKGSIIAFDEMNWDALPGPTLALKDVLGLTKYAIKRSPLQPIPGYIVID